MPSRSEEFRVVAIIAEERGEHDPLGCIPTEKCVSSDPDEIAEFNPVQVQSPKKGGCRPNPNEPMPIDIRSKSLEDCRDSLGELEGRDLEKGPFFYF
ncbi:MAG: hypothetical protein M3Q07_03340 [Pseudobdellovibrionaceae bacterium]|nr:hypothetical protein [Pseudobdellovibrionaceae bacterium]